MVRRHVHNKAEWEQLIGRFVLAFNDIEHEVLLLFHTLPECRFPETAKEMLLKSRLNVLLEVLDDTADSNRARLAQLLIRVRELSERRNVLAHGPMQLDAVNNERGGVSLSGVIVSSRSRRKRLTFNEVSTLADEVDALATQLGEIVAGFLQPDVA